MSYQKTDDVIEVKPRYGIGYEQQQSAQVAQPQPIQPTMVEQSAKAGILNSIYEYKLIILIIVIVIIIIAFVAYFIFRKTDEPDKKSASVPNAMTTQQYQQMTPPPQMETTPQQPPQAVANPRPQPPPAQSEPAQPKNLTNLLERSRNMNHPPANPTVTGSKTEDEIMQLMEDDVPEQHQDTNSADDQEDTEEVIPEPQQTSCSQMLPSGRLCKNRPKTNGKCPKHQS